jgi:hypothetical protein
MNIKNKILKDQNWLEMKKEQIKDLNGNVWIPLKAYVDIERVNKYGELGYIWNSYNIKSVLIPLSKIKEINTLSWNSFIINDTDSGYINENNGNYYPAEFFGDSYSNGIHGIKPVLAQSFNNSLPSSWEVNQDIIFSLKLYKEDNYWISPSENYDKVIKISYDKDNNPNLIEIKNKYLKDYLKARKMGLFVATYTNRDLIMKNRDIVNWEHSSIKIEKIDQLNSHWSGIFREINKQGAPYGEKAALIHIERTDELENDDVPTLGLPNENNEKVSYSEKTFSGEKNYYISGELWKNHWITPGEKSLIIGNDSPDYPIYYIANADGSHIAKEKLKDSGRWLWFSPECINSLLVQRDGKLEWYTKDTGRVGANDEGLVHFGVNKLGYINVYAKDISYLPLWQQQIWVSFNIQPDGGVSKELLMSQVKATPANTQAPEKYIDYGHKYLNKEFLRLYQFPFFTNNSEYKNILKNINRFTSISEDGFYELAKNLTKVSIELINTKAIKKIPKLSIDKNLGSIKTLEQFLIQKLNFDKNEARKQTSLLAGIYELRIKDSHITNSLKEEEKTELYNMLNIDLKLSYVEQGYYLLSNYCSFIFNFVELLRTI